MKILDRAIESLRERISANTLSWKILVTSLMALIPIMLLMWPSHQPVTHSIVQVEKYHSAVVQSVDGGACDGLTDNEMPCAKLKVSIDSKSDIPVIMTRGDYFSDIKIGDHVVVAEVKSDGGSYYVFHAVERSSGLLGLVALTAVAVVAITGRKGAVALLSMALAYLLFWFFLLPGIAQGGDPIQYAAVTCAFIIVTVLYGTHGVNMKTTSALIGTVAGLLTAVLLGSIFSQLMSMSGVTSQTEAIMFQGGNIDLKNLALAGLLVAGIGVLNDITVAQASTVWSVSRESTSYRETIRKALEVGKDHASSAIYTITFSLVGASLGTMIVAGGQGMTLWAWLQDESVAETILQVFVGAIGLVIAMPVTTLVAVYLRDRDKSGFDFSGHFH